MNRTQTIGCGCGCLVVVAFAGALLGLGLIAFLFSRQPNVRYESPKVTVDCPDGKCPPLNVPIPNPQPSPKPRPP